MLRTGQPVPVSRSDTTPGLIIRRPDDVEYEPLEATDDLEMGVLLGPDDGMPNFAMRRFTLAPHGDVPKHTNEVEHEQYVLEGEYVVGVEGEEYTVSEGDSIFIPAGAVHWYRNEHDERGAFICVVPNDEDTIELVD
jgi:quercetin dioxygenase-like cupin family protein